MKDHVVETARVVARRASLVLLPAALTVMGCSPALPAAGNNPEDVRRYALNANQAAADARRYADDARAEFERSEQILKEAEEHVRRAEAARSHCAELVQQIKRQPRKVYRAGPKEAPRAEAQQKQPEPPPTPTPLPHSPSDAP